MSTIGITAPAFSQSVRTTRLRMTARGRRVLAALVAVPVAAGIGFAAMAGGSAIASGDRSEPVSFDTVSVLPGDSLWSVAAEVAPASADVRDVMSDIAALNNLSNNVLVAGSELAIPAEYSE